MNMMNFSPTKYFDYKSLYAELGTYLFDNCKYVPERNGQVLCGRLPHPVTFSIDCMTAGDPFFFIPERRWGHRVAIAEIFWILSSGYNDPFGKDFIDIFKYAKTLKQFKNEEDEYLWAQYGTRLFASGAQENDRLGTNLPVINQMDYCVEQVQSGLHDGKLYLQSNRRLVMTLWSPSLEAVQGKLDYPCNVMVIFDVGLANKVNMTVIRRSNDFIWGIQNNWVQFWSILYMFVHRLRDKFKSELIYPGVITEVINNLHFYYEHNYGPSYDKPKAAVEKFVKSYEKESKTSLQLNADTVSSRAVWDSRDIGKSILTTGFMGKLYNYLVNEEQFYFPQSNFSNYLEGK